MGAGRKRIFLILAVVLVLLVSYLSIVTAYASGGEAAEEMAAEISVESISVFSLIILICCGVVTIVIIVISVISSNKKRKKQDFRQRERS